MKGNRIESYSSARIVGNDHRVLHASFRSFLSLPLLFCVFFCIFASALRTSSDNNVVINDGAIAAETESLSFLPTYLLYSFSSPLTSFSIINLFQGRFFTFAPIYNNNNNDTNVNISMRPLPMVTQTSNIVTIDKGSIKTLIQWSGAIIKTPSQTLSVVTLAAASSVVGGANANYTGSSDNLTTALLSLSTLVDPTTMNETSTTAFSTSTPASDGSNSTPLVPLSSSSLPPPPSLSGSPSSSSSPTSTAASPPSDPSSSSSSSSLSQTELIIAICAPIGGLLLIALAAALAYYCICAQPQKAFEDEFGVELKGRRKASVVVTATGSPARKPSIFGNGGHGNDDNHGGGSGVIPVGSFSNFINPSFQNSSFVTNAAPKLLSQESSDFKTNNTNSSNDYSPPPLLLDDRELDDFDFKRKHSILPSVNNHSVISGGTVLSIGGNALTSAGERDQTWWRKKLAAMGGGGGNSSNTNSSAAATDPNKNGSRKINNAQDTFASGGASVRERSKSLLTVDTGAGDDDKKNKKMQKTSAWGSVIPSLFNSSRKLTAQERSTAMAAYQYQLALSEHPVYLSEMRACSSPLVLVRGGGGGDEGKEGDAGDDEDDEGNAAVGEGGGGGKRDFPSIALARAQSKSFLEKNKNGGNSADLSLPFSGDVADTKNKKSKKSSKNAAALPLMEKIFIAHQKAENPNYSSKKRAKYALEEKALRTQLLSTSRPLISNNVKLRSSSLSPKVADNAEDYYFDDEDAENEEEDEEEESGVIISEEEAAKRKMLKNHPIVRNTYTSQRIPPAIILDRGDERFDDPDAEAAYFRARFIEKRSPDEALQRGISIVAGKKEGAAVSGRASSAAVAVAEGGNGDDEESDGEIDDDDDED